MSKSKTWRSIRPLLAALALLLATAACGGRSKTYEATFDSAGSWGSGDNADVVGQVQNGVYDMLVKADSGLFWATGGETGLGTGVYEVQATQMEGPLDNGYGMMFAVDNENDNFQLLEVSGDGFIWIGSCQGGCETAATPLVGDGWFESAAVRQGLNNANTLRVTVTDTEVIYAVNGQEVGRVNSTEAGLPQSGDIGLLVETLGAGGVRVAFDNFRYSPPGKE